MSVTLIPPVVYENGEYKTYQIPAAEYHTVCQVINRCNAFMGDREKWQAQVTLGRPDEKGAVEHVISIFNGEVAIENRIIVIGAIRRSWDADLSFHS